MIAGIVIGVIAAALVVPGAVVAMNTLRGLKRQTGGQQIDQ